ncbi:hypothetical protein FDE85_02595 [Clostridium botulinum]|nr:hypothetical protein [Clostridium botulinum]NFT97952.1 hypothetical protein [Clostridium botulinum]
MRGILRNLKKIQRNNIYYLIVGAQILCLLSYYYLIDGLAKPAGISEALRFLFFNSAEYAGAIYMGILAWIINITLITSVVVEIPFIKDFINDYINYYSFRYNYEEENIEKNKFIINLFLMLILLICNAVFLTYLFLLIFVIVLIILAIIFLFK